MDLTQLLAGRTPMVPAARFVGRAMGGHRKADVPGGDCSGVVRYGCRRTDYSARQV